MTGWRVPQVHWSGVRLSAGHRQRRVRPGGQAIRLTSFDGTYTDSLTLDQARLPDVILAPQMLGGDVTPDHGGPVRLYAAAMYEFKSVKWLSGIEAIDRVIPGYLVGSSNGQGIDERI